MSRSLRRRYGRAASHPLFPRLVMYLEKSSPKNYVVTAKLQKHYGGAWHTVIHEKFGDVRSAIDARTRLGHVVATKHDVPDSHVEFA